jgi:hypothetical protein
MYGVAATWRPASSRWFYQLRLDRIESQRNLDTALLRAGIGYRLEQDGSFSANSTARGWERRSHEAALYAGKTIINSLESEADNSPARSVEYRHAFGPVLRGSLAWLNEGDARLIRRNGVLAQAWLEPGFHGDRFTLGLGFGGYLAVDHYREDGRDLLGVLSTTASYHFAHGWLGRITWHRIASRHDRDSDIILLGAGYRF